MDDGRVRNLGCWVGFGELTFQLPDPQLQHLIFPRQVLRFCLIKGTLISGCGSGWQHVVVIVESPGLA